MAMCGSLEARFWAKVDKSGDCWLWTGGGDGRGYGAISGMKAHRASWLIKHGSLNASKDVLHRCDNPLCVNPDHLFLGDQSTNNADRDAKGRTSKGEFHWYAKVTVEQVKEMRKARTDGATIKSLATRYGICRSNVGMIINRKSWAHV